MTWRFLMIEAWQALAAYARRSVLTLLGIAWGITTLVMLLAYGSGFQNTVLFAFEAFGTNMIEVWGGRTSSQAGGQRAGRWIRLQLDDMEYVAAAVPQIRSVSPQLWRWMPVISPLRTQDFGVIAVYPAFGRIRRMEASDGRWLTAADESERARVVVLGSSAKERLFGDAPALGQQVRIGGISFDVVGVLKKKVGGPGEDDNRQVFMPFSAMNIVQPSRYLDSFLAELDGPRSHLDVKKQIRERLATKLGFLPTDQRALGVFAPEQEVEKIRIVTGMLRVLVGFIGALTLTIGGVGVTNIMLVAVTQRTREIGVRKALGARRRHILTQFLAEAVLITFAGGLAGLAFSWFLAWLIPPLPLWSALTGEPGGDIVLRIDWRALVTATAMLVAVGLAAGMWPALRAAKLSPVEALRYE
jgi:putative ABC transport system permease protein